MTDTDIHDLARMLYEAHMKNAGQAQPLWDDLGKVGRSQWRLLARIAATEVGKRNTGQQSATAFMNR